MVSRDGWTAGTDGQKESRDGQAEGWMDSRDRWTEKWMDSRDGSFSWGL